LKAPPRLVADPAPAVLRPGGRLARFAAVGVSGVAVNLGVLHLLAAVLRAPEILSSALAIEASIVSNFLLHDAFTFRDRRAGARAGAPGRLLRYHAVSALGALVQLGTFVLAALALSRASGRTDLGALRYVAQAVGIAAAFLWSFGGSSRFAWATGEVPVRERLAVAALAPRLLFAALLVLHVVPIWAVHYFPTQDGALHVENVLALLGHASSPLLQSWYLPNWARSRTGSTGDPRGAPPRSVAGGRLEEGRAQRLHDPLRARASHRDAAGDARLVGRAPRLPVRPRLPPHGVLELLLRVRARVPRRRLLHADRAGSSVRSSSRRSPRSACSCSSPTWSPSRGARRRRRCLAWRGRSRSAAPAAAGAAGLVVRRYLGRTAIALAAASPGLVLAVLWLARPSEHVAERIPSSTRLEAGGQLRLVSSTAAS
jgi:putative flippase GtrA